MAVTLGDAGEAARSGHFASDILTFHQFWDSCRGARAMPARGDFDPAEMIPYLAGITLIDVVAGSRRFVYRLVGTREVAMRGNDPTGKGIGEGFFADSAESAMAAYQDVVDRRAPRFERRRFIAPNGRIGNEQSVLLPLSDDDLTVNKIIAYTHHSLG